MGGLFSIELIVVTEIKHGSYAATVTIGLSRR